MTKAHLEITSGVLRVFRSGEGLFGQPFDIAFAVSGDEGVATLMALRAVGLIRSDFTAAAEALKAAGFHTMRWTRKTPDSLESKGVAVREYRL